MTSSSQTGTRINTVSQTPFAPQATALERLFPAATELLDTPRLFPDFDTVVPLSQQTETGLQLGEARAIGGSPLNQAAQDTILSTARGDFLGRENPNFGAFADRITGDIGSRINAQFGAAGRLGSQANAEALSRGIGDVLAPLAFQDFQRERQNQLAASQFAPQLANQDFVDIERLLDVGRVREGQAAASLEDAIRRFNFQQDEPRQRIADVFSLVAGGNFGGTTEQAEPIFENTGANVLGGITSGVSALGTLFGGDDSIFGSIF